MAGWLKRVDGSGLESFKTPQKFRKKETWLDFQPVCVKAGEQQQDRRDELKSSFDEFLSVFLQETFGTSCIRPLPPMLGDGKSVDLFKLYLKVRKRGGYERVSENCLWDSVAKECGFDSSVGLALKLVYSKYLHALSCSLQKAVANKDSKSGVTDSSPDSFGGRLMHLESNLEGFLSGNSEKKKKVGVYTNIKMRQTQIEFFYDGKLSNTDEHMGIGKKSAGIDHVGENGVESINNRGAECLSEIRNDNDDCIAAASDLGEGRGVESGDVVNSSVVVEEGADIRKRRREFVPKMLKWIHMVAKDPCDPAIGNLPERSKWKSYPSDEVWKQVLFVREACLRKDIDSSDQQGTGQKKQKMHPFMYDDHVRTSPEKLRFSQRLISAKDTLKKTGGQISSMSSSSGTDEDSVDPQSDSIVDPLPDYLVNRRKKRMSLGPQHQADVPEWTGEAYESDNKWLGTKMWPLEKAEQSRNLIERERVGRGRQDSCGCQFPGSNECVRFHISEKRMRLRLELGPAFYRWDFNDMGEEVACSWTKEEEKKFQDTVKSNPSSLEKYFWDELVKAFPGKSRRSLVSYYFNVFLLRQRGQQNRTTPVEINSDEEETAGFEAEAAPNPGSIFCSPKKANPGSKQ